MTTKNGSFVLYPDGLRVSINSVRQVEVATLMGETDEPDDVVVLVVHHVANTGKAPIALTSDGWSGYTHKLAYGQNRYDAQGWAVGRDAVTRGAVGTSNGLPERLMPGTSVDVESWHTLPRADVDVLRFTVNPDSERYTNYTFADVETLLKK